MKFGKLFFLLVLSLHTLSCKGKSLETVKEVDINKYCGTWYEIAKLPNSFEKGLKCITATYGVKENGKISVLNKGTKIDNPNKISYVKGTAWIPDINYPAKLKVRFFWPFSGNYWILALDKNYQYALVGDPSRKYLWILCRSAKMNEETYNFLLSIAKEKGFEISKVEKVIQDCN